VKYGNDGSSILFETGECIGGARPDRCFPVFEQVQVNFHAFSHRLIGVLCTITFLYEALYVSSLPFDGTMCQVLPGVHIRVSARYISQEK
jgi:hypothetical protein